MSCYIVEGGSRLSGEVEISGAKNAVLPILAAGTALKELRLRNIPFLSDVSNTLLLMKKLGKKISTEGGGVTITDELSSTEIDKELSCKMRSSVLFMGAVLGRYGEVSVVEPGGCRLGERPIDIHLWSMEQLGAEIINKDDRIICKGHLKGAEITIPIVSVGVTENIILAAVNAEGTTIIKNCAMEPEIDDLIACLNLQGCRIRREKTTIVIEESRDIHCRDHSIMPDRIEAGTYIAMAAATGGELFIKNANPCYMRKILSVFEKTGCIIKAEHDKIYIDAPLKLSSVPEIITKPYPYFPTDMQPQIMAVLSKAEGSCVIKETLFSARNKHIPQLNKMGADIKCLSDNLFEIRGVESLRGTNVESMDLRGGAALVVAALGAEGVSRIDGIKYIERGYECLCAKVGLIGGKIKKVAID